MQNGALRNQVFKDYGIRLTPVNKGKNKEEQIDFTQDFLAQGKFYVVENNNNRMFDLEMKNYKWKKDSVEKGKPEPDKQEQELNEEYTNTHSKERAYYYNDHTCDGFMYYVIMNKEKLGLKF